MNKLKFKNILTILLFVVLLLSGIGKLLDSSGTENLLNLALYPQGHRQFPLNKIFVVLLSSLELILAIGVFTKWKRIVIKVIANLFLLFTIFLISFPIRGIEIANCSCFGALIPNGILTIALVRNLLLILATIILLKEETIANIFKI